MIRRFWMSFADFTKPEGQQLLGACVVEVTDDDVEHAREKITRQWPGREDDERAVLGGAALYVAWRDGCNAGGEVCVIPMPDEAWAEMEKSGVKPSRMFTADQLKQWATVEIADVDIPKAIPDDQTS